MMPLPFSEELLTRMVIDLLSKGAGIPEPLSGVLRTASRHHLLTIALESVHGPLLDSAPQTHSPSDTRRNLLALPALADEQNIEKRFFFAMTQKRWQVLSGFSIGNEPFFTTLTLDAAHPASTSLKAGLFRLADYVTVQCKKLLHRYIETVIDSMTSGLPAAVNYTVEKSILEKITGYSDQVQCAVLLDEDGFIIHNEGPAGSVDELGGALARLFYRSNHELARLDCTDCSAITLADHEYTIRIGRLSGTSLALAVSMCGPYAAAGAHFLHAIGSETLVQYAQQTGHLWGVPLAEHSEPARRRNSWFGPPSLIPHGKFVGKKGGKSFHTVDCQILAKTDTHLLTWFESRSAAIQQGHRPCGACNP